VLQRYCITLLLFCFHWLQHIVQPPLPVVRPPLDQLAALPEEQLPVLVRQCPIAMRYLRRLGTLNWSHFPQRPGRRVWPGPKPAPRSPFVAAFLVKIEEQKPSMGSLRTFLVEHPALIWLFGFPLVADPNNPWGFDPKRTLASRQHFSRVLRSLHPDQTRFLLQASLHLLRAELADVIADEKLPHFGDEISLDTKHILAWVRENNPKEFVPDRYDKHNQPTGDPDCKLGCKKKSNLSVHDGSNAAPTQDAMPASTLEVGHYYWGYASGVVATKVGNWGEVVLAERTQTFDHSDQSYFLPLMEQTQQHLGRKPRFGAFDGAFDAFYVYEYFHHSGGFAAVPYAGRKDHAKQFDADGLPLCAADLAMPLRNTFQKTSHCLVPHEMGRYGCPLLYPTPTGQSCPIHHPNWAKEGCITTLATSIGAQIRHQLDRECDAYKQLYNQRSATERINSQALALGIETPHLRNANSIANQNTLIYVTINLRTLHRIRNRKALGR
jgi:hypothetical protein